MIEVIHRPFGHEHPYQQLPEERCPRRPLAGEQFTVGIVTRPAGAVSRVTVHQANGDKPLPDVTARHLVNWQPTLETGVGMEYLQNVAKIDQDVWQATLTAPPFGERLTYWIETDTGTRTEAFTLTGETWQPGGGARAEGDALVFARNAPPVEPRPQRPRLLALEWLTDGVTARHVRLTFACDPDERFFGLGERFNALNQRGNTLDIRCYEQYRDQGTRTYIPIPFLLSSAGYGVWVDSSRWMQFELATSTPDVWTLEADLGPDETLRLVWFTGDSPEAIIGKFSTATGPAALPPLWAFGLWMSSNEWNSQARAIQEVETSFRHEIIPSVIVLEAWSDEATFYIWNDAEYTPRDGGEAFRYGDFRFPPDGKWPDPAGMIDWLHERGLKVILWQIPVMKQLTEPHAQHDADRAHFEREGYGVRNPDGSLHRLRPAWFRGGYVWDPTNPAARDWWFAKRAYLVDELGVDGFKTDGGEHIWGTDLRFHGGRLSDELWNEYPLHYTEAYYRFVNEHRHGDALTFSRAGFTGSQRAPAHWAGDERSTWDAFRHSILAGLNAGISGIPFWGWDIAGFSGEIPSAELYLRAAAMAAFCPIMQYHSEFNAHREPHIDRTPWNIQTRTGDERVIPTFRFLVNVRHNLMPYIWQEARHSAATGEPMMRALALYDRLASPYQYFFGRDLLVSPVVEEGATRWPVYLPPGVWFDLWTGARFEGGQTHNLDAPLDRLPVFVRAGARIPARLPESGALGDFVPLSGEPNTYLEFGD